MDQEKLAMSSVVAGEHRPHNASPSQKTAMPRWRGKGKEKSTIARACTWIVDHQISIVPYDTAWRLLQSANALQALPSISFRSSSSSILPSQERTAIRKCSLAFLTTTKLPAD